MIHKIKNITEARKIKSIQAGDAFVIEVEMDPMEEDLVKLEKLTAKYDQIVEHLSTIPVEKEVKDE